MKRSKWIAVVLAALLFAGCGSGGGTFDEEFNEIEPGQGTQPNPQTPLKDIGYTDAASGYGWIGSSAFDISNSGLVALRTFGVSFIYDVNDDTVLEIGSHYDVAQTMYDDRPLHFSYPLKINNSGRLIGFSTIVDYHDELDEAIARRAFAFDLETMTFIDLHPDLSSKPFSTPVAVNETGDIFITAQGDSGNDAKHAYLIDGTTFQRIRVGLEYEGAKSSEAVGLNDDRFVTYNSGEYAYYCDYSPNSPTYGHCTNLGSLIGQDGAKAVAINNSYVLEPPPSTLRRPHIIGNSGNLGFFWEAGAMHPIGQEDGATYEVVALNNHDQVVGNRTEGGTTRAFLWKLVNGKGVMTDLGTLGGNSSRAVAINDRGEVIGYSTTGSVYAGTGARYEVENAFLWKNGVMYNLGSHSYFYPYIFKNAYPFSHARAINDNGAVVGDSMSINSNHRAFYRAPTP